MVYLPIFAGNFTGINVAGITEGATESGRSFKLPSFFRAVGGGGGRSVVTNVVGTVFCVLLVTGKIFCFFVRRSVVHLVNLDVALSVLFIFALVGCFL